MTKAEKQWSRKDFMMSHLVSKPEMKAAILNLELVYSKNGNEQSCMCVTNLVGMKNVCTLQFTELGKKIGQKFHRKKRDWEIIRKFLIKA